MTKENPELSDNSVRMRKASGEVSFNDPLITFIYVLTRGYLSLGQVEELMRHSNLNDLKKDYKINFTNGWLANYAENVAERLRANDKNLGYGE